MANVNYVQTTYTETMSIGMEGQIASTFNLSVRSGQAVEKLFFGRGLVAFEEGYKVAAADKITFSADFSSGEVITGKVLVSYIDSDGVQTDTETSISVNWNTNQATTLANVVTAIEAVSGINASTASSGRAITVVANTGKVVKLYGWAAAGGSAPTVQYDMTSTFAGVSEQSNKEPDSNGDVYYKSLEAVNVVTRADMFVYVDRAVSRTDVPYLRIVADTGDNQAVGQFTTSTNSAKAVTLSGKAVFLTSTTAAGLVKLGLLNV